MKNVNLSDGEVLSIRGVDDNTLVVLANQTLLVEGQVIRSPTNTISVYFRTFQDEAVGTFQLHYQGGCPGPMGAPSAACRVGANGGACPAGVLGLIATHLLLTHSCPHSAALPAQALAKLSISFSLRSYKKWMSSRKFFLK